MPWRLVLAPMIESAVGTLTFGVTGGFEERELVRVLRCVREALDA